MKKIINPFAKINHSDRYSCFGCSPFNENGLKMEFHEEGDEIVSFWNPDEKFEGFQGVLHGGIQAALIDEIASWVVFVKLGTGGFTSELNVKYLKTLMIEKGRITLRASLKTMEKNIAHIAVFLYDGKDVLCSEGVASYFTLPEKIAASKLKYPGIDSFYD